MDQVTCGSFDPVLWPSPHDHMDTIPQEACIEEQWGVIKNVNKT